MKKLVQILMFVLFLTSCSKEDDSNIKFNSETQDVLSVLNGKWKSDGIYPETLTFKSYNEPTEIPSVNTDWASLEMHGLLTREFTLLGESDKWNMVFYINTSKKTISAYEIINSKYTIVTSKIYDYTIVDNNTIRLHDQSLSQLNIETYIRQ